MATIYLVDYLGVHCGMHYYLEAFRRALGALNGYDVKYVSNHSESISTKPVLLNQYNGNIIKKITFLLINLFRLYRLVKKHKEDIFIYLTYGNAIDLPYMKIVTGAKYHVIDIHEAIAQNVDTDEKLKQKFKKIYSRNVKTVISHSTRTDNFLEEYGFCGKRFAVPHFKYILPKDFNMSNIPNEIKNAPNPDKINLLFFGNLNESKGVDILIDAVNILDNDIADKINVTIAGKDFDGAVDRVKPMPGRNIKIIRRRINDDELKYLYSKTDYLTLPYRKTSQSGILEMAFYFKKPIIASDVPYFRKTLSEFPSFGILAGMGSDNYAKAITQAIANYDSSVYFNDEDYAHYENREEIAIFVKNFKNWLEKHNYVQSPKIRPI